MNLDDHTSFTQWDPQNLLAEIANLPDQLVAAWEKGQSLFLAPWLGVRQVVIAAMGTSALAADLLTTYLTPTCQLPIAVVRNYNLPAWVNGPETLLICTSYSGDTEEILSAFEQAVSRDCRILVITTGGQLAAAAQKFGADLWPMEPCSLMGTAVGSVFGLLLAAFSRLELIPDTNEDLVEARAAMVAQQVTLGAAVPVMQNEAKRLAGQCVGRWLAVFGSDHLAPVARYWKIQLNHLAKTWAQFEILPEADHNTLVGVQYPSQMIGQTMLLFLRSQSCHPRNQLRAEVTKEYFMLEGLGTDFFNAQGDTLLAQIWTALHFGDYLAYYLAMAYGVQPAILDTVEGLKAYLREE